MRNVKSAAYHFLNSPRKEGLNESISKLVNERSRGCEPRVRADLIPVTNRDRVS